jgi:hypothetical protein
MRDEIHSLFLTRFLYRNLRATITLNYKFSEDEKTDSYIQPKGHHVMVLKDLSFEQLKSKLITYHVFVMNR